MDASPAQNELNKRVGSSPPDEAPGSPAARPSILELIRRFLFGRRLADLDFGSFQLPAYDVEKILTDLDVRGRAQRNGERDIPAPSDVQLDGVERLIVQEIETQLRTGKNRLESRLSNITRRIEQADVARLCAQVTSLPAALARDLAAVESEVRDRLQLDRDAYRQARDELNAFKLRVGVRWDPHYPESHAWHWAVLGALFAIESILNGSFFAVGNELALAGGVPIAAASAIVNLAFSFWLGLLGRFCLSRQPRPRALGSMSLVLFVGWTTLYNLVLAHVRDVYATRPDATLALARDLFVASPLGFQDPVSWILLLIGCVFSVVAMLDGWRWDDPEPGYGRLHRRMRDLRAEYFHSQQSLESESRAQLAARHDELERLSEKVGYSVASLEIDVENKRTLVANARSFFEYSEASANTMLSLYRDLNRQHRKAPPPRYFQQPWSHPLPDVFKGDISSDLEKLERQRRLRRDLDKQHEPTRKGFEEALNEALQRVRSLPDPEDELPANPVPTR